MSAHDYAASDLWPTHPKAHWKDALADARGAGWHLHYVGADHRYGDVYCPEEECTFRVDWTAAKGSYHASQAVKKVRRCRHGENAGLLTAKERIARAGSQLRQVEAVISQAAHRIDLIEAHEGGWAQLADLEAERDELALRLQTASLTLDEVANDVQDDLDEIERRIDAELEGIEGSASPPDAADVSADLATAAEVLVEVEADVTRLRKGRATEVVPLLERAAELGAAVATLTARLPVRAGE